ncbi:MAG: AAA family ATPase [Lentimicrobium sp.]
MLTHLYDDSHKALIIDEPELNLHPQFQAFLVQEIRKLAGGPANSGKKLIFLVTHSPFILDINNKKDLSSIICFHSELVNDL